MRDAVADRRIWLASAVLAALALFGVAGSATAGPATGLPVPSEATATAFGHGDVQVEDLVVSDHPSLTSPSSSSAFLCVSATRTLHHGKSRRTITRQQGCSRSIVYRFDAITWTAEASGRFLTSTRTTEQRLLSGQWTTTVVHEGDATVTVDLRWLASDDVHVEPHVSGPGICYTMPPSVCGGVYVERVERGAVVSGGIDFAGLGVSVPVPEAHPGTVSIG